MKATPSDHSAESLTIWVLEDNQLARESLQTIVQREPGFECPHALASAEALFAVLEREDPPDLLLVDLGLPGVSGIEAIRRVAGISPGTRVIVVTVHAEDEQIFEAVCAGATGYLLKPSSPSEIVAAVHDVERGAAPINPYIARRMLRFFREPRRSSPAADGYGLTRRELEILEKLVEGKTSKEIATALELSHHTISNHLRNVYAKLQVHSRAAAVGKALREDLI